MYHGSLKFKDFNSFQNFLEWKQDMEKEMSSRYIKKSSYSAVTERDIIIFATDMDSMRLVVKVFSS